MIRSFITRLCYEVRTQDSMDLSIRSFQKKVIYRKFKNALAFEYTDTDNFHLQASRKTQRIDVDKKKKRMGCAERKKHRLMQKSLVDHVFNLNRQKQNIP